MRGKQHTRDAGEPAKGMRERQAMRGRDAGECAACGRAAAGDAESTKQLRKAKNSPAEEKHAAEGEIRENPAQPRKIQRKFDFENSYLFFQEESGKMINREVLAMDLSFKLI